MKVIATSLYKTFHKIQKDVFEKHLFPYTEKQKLTEKQELFVMKKVWSLIEDELKPSPPTIQEVAFLKLLGFCKIEYSEAAKRISMSSYCKKKITENNIKGYVFQVRKNIEKNAIEKSSKIQWSYEVGIRKD